MAFSIPHCFHDHKVNVGDIFFSSATLLCKLQFADDTTSLQLCFTDETTLSTTYSLLCILSLLVFSLPRIPISLSSPGYLLQVLQC